MNGLCEKEKQRTTDFLGNVKKLIRGSLSPCHHEDMLFQESMRLPLVRGIAIALRGGDKWKICTPVESCSVTVVAIELC
ncbi:hypothetical protein M513_04800 [Trichuris suis]|uniref:Uncharacterized protein n=1 Tax=Trichuris suis TaxID=68888 RepID=A0A085MAL2_9BILA|nr:hypothetical protein M513_04800 [Trichuris suis]